MHSQLRGHQTLQRLVGKRRRLPQTEGSLGSNDQSNIASPPVKQLSGKEQTWHNMGGKENASSVSCPICNRSVPAADGALNAHIDACLARTSVSAKQAPKKTTQTTLARFTSPRAKLGPASKSLPSPKSQTPVYQRSISLPALRPWDDADLLSENSVGKKRGLEAGRSPNQKRTQELSGSPGAKRRKHSKESAVPKHEAAEYGVVLDLQSLQGSKDRSQGIQKQEVLSDLQAAEGNDGSVKALATLSKPICAPTCEETCKAEGNLESNGLNFPLSHLDTWAVGRKFQEPTQNVNIKTAITLLREPENPKDSNAILVCPENTSVPLLLGVADSPKRKRRVLATESLHGAAVNGRDKSKGTESKAAAGVADGSSQKKAGRSTAAASKGKTPTKGGSGTLPGKEASKLESSGKDNNGSIIGHLPAVVSAHLAPLMDRFGVSFRGEVTVLPQCAAASMGIRIYAPLFLEPSVYTEATASAEEGPNRELETEDCIVRSHEEAERSRDFSKGSEVPSESGQVERQRGCKPEETAAPCELRLKGGQADSSKQTEIIEVIEQKIDIVQQIKTRDFEIYWRSACEAAARARASLVADPSLPKYQGNFLYITRTVLDADGHLITDEEKELLKGIEGLAGDGQRLVVRLFQRKGPWFRVSALSYADVLNIPRTVRELVRSGYLLSSLQSQLSAKGPTSEASSDQLEASSQEAKPSGVMTRRRSLSLQGSQDRPSSQEQPGVQRAEKKVLGGTKTKSAEPRWNPQAPDNLDEGYARDRLAVLNVGELREVLCSLSLKTKLEANAGKRDELLRWILEAACDAQQTTPWGQGCYAAVLEKVDELAGQCIRLTEKLSHLLWRVQRLFFLNGEQDLSAFLLVDMGVCKYPQYRCSRTRPIFKSRSDLLAYEEALDVAQRMDEAVEAGDTAAALRLLEVARSSLDARNPSNRTIAEHSTVEVAAIESEEHPPGGDAKLPGSTGALAGSSPDGPTVQANVSDGVEAEESRLGVESLSGDQKEPQRQSVEGRDCSALKVCILEPAQVELPSMQDCLLPSRCTEMVESKRAVTFEQIPSKLERDQEQLGLTSVAHFTPAKKEEQLAPIIKTPPPLFVARFAAGWVYSVVATVGVSILEKEKRYSEAVTVLRQLLGGGHSRGRRGQWWGRLSINLDHLGRKEESLQAAEEGVEDSWVRGGDRLGLQRRVCRLSKPPRRWRKPHYCEAVTRLYSPSICPETRIGGRPLNCEVGAKSRFYNLDNQQCGVEQLALHYYGSEEGGGWKGVHSEGGVWCTLFGLLMWEVLFMDVQEVFRTPFQTAPLDLDTDAFFPTRQAAIMERLALIRTGDVASMLAVRWATSAGTWCRGVNWERHNLEELQTIALCVGNEGLTAVCRLLAEDHAGWAGGMPDLLLWREQKTGLDGVPLTADQLAAFEETPDTEKSMEIQEGCELLIGETHSEGLKEGVNYVVKREAKLVEVKGPRDRLSEQQRAWIGALQAAGIAVEVCKVVEDEARVKKDKRKK